MPQWLELLIVLGAWAALQTWLQPRMGAATRDETKGPSRGKRRSEILG